MLYSLYRRVILNNYLVCVANIRFLFMICSQNSIDDEMHIYNKFPWMCVCLFNSCWGLTSILNIWRHIATVPTCSSDILTNVLPHRNAMPQTQDIPHPVTVYRYRVDLSVCYPLMWNVTLGYTTTHFNVLGQTRYGNILPWTSSNTSERSTLWCWYGGSQSEAR